MAEEVPFTRRPSLQKQQDEPQPYAGPRRFFKTVAGPGITAYPSDAGAATAGQADVYYARYIRDVAFTETVGRQTLSYTNTATPTYEYICNLVPDNYIPVGSICLCFREGGRWYTIDPLPTGDGTPVPCETCVDLTLDAQWSVELSGFPLLYVGTDLDGGGMPDLGGPNVVFLNGTWILQDIRNFLGEPDEVQGWLPPYDSCISCFGSTTPNYLESCTWFSGVARLTNRSPSWSKYESLQVWMYISDDSIPGNVICRLIIRQCIDSIGGASNTECFQLAVYTCSTFDCAGPNVFSRDSSIVSAPSTLTVTLLNP